MKKLFCIILFGCIACSTQFNAMHLTGFLAQGAPEAIREWQRQKLYQAISYGNCQEIETYFLNQGANVDATTIDLLTHGPIQAAQLCHKHAEKKCGYDILKLLLDRGAKVDACNGLGFTAFDLVVMAQCKKSVQLIVTSGLDLDAIKDRNLLLEMTSKEIRDFVLAFKKGNRVKSAAKRRKIIES